MNRPAPRSTGFTLLEMLIVVVMVGAISVLVASRLTAGTRGARQHDAVRTIAASLAEARVMAMRKAAPETVEVTWNADQGGIEAVWRSRHRAWRIDLAPVSPDREPLDALSARFDPEGRTSERRWRFKGSRRGDTIWVIDFDPVSGAPAMGRETDGAG